MWSNGKKRRTHSAPDIFLYSMINLHTESIRMQGAKCLLLAIAHQGGRIAMTGGKDGAIYDKAIFNELLHNREFLLHFMKQGSWQYYDHQRNKKGQLISVKINFLR